MADPWVPPYFGSWQQLVNSLLHNPFLGSGHGGRPHVTHLEEARYNQSPVPDPWLPVSFLLAAVTLRVAAESMPDGSQKGGLTAQANRTIADFIDDFCGNRSPFWQFPWPWPGPPPWVLPVVSQLTLVANSLQPGALQKELQGVAGQMLQRAFASTGVGNPG